MHTPGPWTIIENYGSYQSEIDGGGRAIATVWTKQQSPHVSNAFKESSTIPWPEGVANAALIASAPDLLAEVERLTAANAALAQERAELRAALEPLAAIELSDLLDDDWSIRFLDSERGELIAGDVRRAKRALGEGK